MARKAPIKELSREERPVFLAQLAALEGVDPSAFPARARQAVEQYHDAVLAGHVDALDDAETVYAALVYLLNGGTFMGCKAEPDSSGNVLCRAVSAPAGQVPRWGQSGTFLLEVGSLRLRMVIDANMLGNHLPVELWAVDLDQPFLSETGYRATGLTVTSCLGKTVDQAAKALVLGILASEGRPKPIRPDEVERMRRYKTPGWLADALAGVKPDGQMAMFGDAPPAKAPLTNAQRQKALRERRKAQQLKPVMLTEAERLQLVQWREQQDEPGVMCIALTSTDRCVLSLGLLAHEDLDHRPANWETSKKPGFDALLRKLWPEGDNGRYLAEPERSTRRPAARLRDRIAALEMKVANLEKQNAFEVAECAKAYKAAGVLTERLKLAGLCHDYRKQPGE